MQTILGIDYGAKRIGLAIGDNKERTAEPMVTLNQPDMAIGQIQAIITEHRVDQIVVGLPRNLDGNDTSQTAAVRQFAAELERATKLPVVLQDEAVTSEEAVRQLTAKHPRGFDRGLIDQQAAAIILQDYLSAL